MTLLVNSWLAIMHLWGFAMYSGLVMLSTLVSYVYLGMCIIEMTSFVVRVNGESKSTRLPCYGAIEVRESDVLVVLPCIENISLDRKSVV